MVVPKSSVRSEKEREVSKCENVLMSVCLFACVVVVYCAALIRVE